MSETETTEWGWRQCRRCGVMHDSDEAHECQVISFVEAVGVSESSPIYLDQPVRRASRTLDGPPQAVWSWPALVVASDLDIARRRARHKRQRNARRDGRQQRRDYGLKPK